jgi:hypothetical protein
MQNRQKEFCQDDNNGRENFTRPSTGEFRTSYRGGFRDERPNESLGQDPSEPTGVFRRPFYRDEAYVFSRSGQAMHAGGNVVDDRREWSHERCGSLNRPK